MPTRLNIYGQAISTTKKRPCIVATTTNIVLSGASTPTSIDGVNIGVDDRILVWQQNSPQDNGIYRLETSQLLSRDYDFNISDDLYAGIEVLVLSGLTYSGKTFYLTTLGDLTIGSSSLTFDILAGQNGTSGTSGGTGSSGASGSSGTSGTEGTSGSSGSSGTSGTEGTSGSSGSSGTSGGTGSSGASGSSGTSGTEGTSGSSGSSGTSGTEGTSGSSGSSGTSGGTGSSGASGSSGTSGTEGTSGSSGSSGTSGTEGTSGSSGSSGTSGTEGTSGSSGTSGTEGTSGSSGSSGTSGTEGTSGTSGASGSSGTSGNTGASGSSGTSGNTGASGSSGTSGSNAGITSYTNPADNRVITSVSSTSINAEANLTFDGTVLTVTGTITETSSKHIKENIKTLENSLEIIKKLRGVEYNRIGSSLSEVGFIAEEVEDFLPQIVTKDYNGNPSSVSYGRLVALLVEAVKKQDEQIQNLTKRIEELEK